MFVLLAEDVTHIRHGEKGKSLEGQNEEREIPQGIPRVIDRQLINR